MPRISFILSLTLISILITACSNGQATTIPEEVPSSTLVGEAISTSVPGYPEPVIAAPTVDQGYPAPDNNVSTPLPSPTYDQTMGIIKGRLLLNNTPVQEAILSLAEVIKDSSGREMVVSYDPSSSPTTVTDPEGYFEFVNVAPSKYGLILDTVVKSYLLHYPDEGDEQILIVVEEGQVVNIGDLDYDSLPVQMP